MIDAYIVHSLPRESIVLRPVNSHMKLRKWGLNDVYKHTNQGSNYLLVIISMASRFLSNVSFPILRFVLTSIAATKFLAKSV